MCVSREAYFVSRNKDERHSLFVLRFTRYEIRFTLKRGRSACLGLRRQMGTGEAVMNHAGQEGDRPCA